MGDAVRSSAALRPNVAVVRVFSRRILLMLVMGGRRLWRGLAFCARVTEVKNLRHDGEQQDEHAACP